MHSYNNVAGLRHFRGAFFTAYPQRRGFAVAGRSGGPESPDSAARSVDLNVEVANFLAQGVAVEAQQIRRPDLIAPSRGQGRRPQRHLDFPEDAVVKPRRGHAVRKAGEMGGERDFDRAAKIVDAMLSATAGGDGGRR